MVKKAVGSISISGVLSMSMHSLNNEGGEGNQIQTRQVTVVDSEGKLVGVNAVSGDMFKHIQAEHLQNVAKENGLPLCTACSKGDANRISNDPDFEKAVKELEGDAEITLKMLNSCVVDDLEGILITAGNRNTARKSVVEFGWVIGIPEQTKTDSYFHVKYVPNAGKKQETDNTGSNKGQNIYYRPANSGNYAVVANIEVMRIGFNDYSREYSISAEEREKRYRALLKSIIYTFVQPSGAMRNTQNPHISNFTGVISVSGGNIPAPLVSGLNSNFMEETEKIKGALNSVEEEEIIQVYPFFSLSQFVEIMGQITGSTFPYELK